MTAGDNAVAGSGAGLPPPDSATAGFVEAAATRFGIPGVAVGVWANGRETFACLAGRVIEKVGGMPYERAVVRFAPERYPGLVEGDPEEPKAPAPSTDCD
ncbi:hypothetical protein AB0C76_04695 [Kitasatospora sp. NPDC048722]|uniref:hypothetical protein n=1 Tax=Kitasatospora sp. NPDC048722 TaxID=3155639 RepID=UPI0033DE9351